MLFLRDEAVEGVIVDVTAKNCDTDYSEERWSSVVSSSKSSTEHVERQASEDCNKTVKESPVTRSYHLSVAPVTEDAAGEWECIARWDSLEWTSSDALNLTVNGKKMCEGVLPRISK